MAALFTVVMLASIGLPGLSGFVSEYLILIGTFATHSWWAVVATFGVVPRRCTCSGPTSGSSTAGPRAPTPRSPTRRPTSSGSWCRSSCLIVVLGVFPKPVLDRITPSVQQLDPPRRAGRGEQVKLVIPSIHYLAILPVLIFFGAALALVLRVGAAARGVLRSSSRPRQRRGAPPRRSSVNFFQWRCVARAGASVTIAHAIVLDDFSVVASGVIAL